MGKVGRQKRVLLIDDDHSLLKILSLQLTYNGYVVDTARTGATGFEKATRGGYDIIVLDMGLPDQKGTQVCTDLRKSGIITPILILSGDTSKKTIVEGLRAGADDYLEKPFYKVELLERLNAIIRRNQRSFPSSLLSFGDLLLDVQSRTIEANHAPIKLTIIEVSVMRCLMQYAPKIVGREDLFERVWGINKEHTSNRLDVYVRRLRHKLSRLDTGITIQTVYGKGYQLK